jgi:hypothetical protein
MKAYQQTQDVRMVMRENQLLKAQIAELKDVIVSFCLKANTPLQVQSPTIMPRAATQIV